MDRQPRVVDLLPRHYGWIAAVFVLGAALVAGLEAGHYYLPQLAPFSASGRIAALDLAGDGSLATWLGAALLSSAAVAAWVVYGVRKHRADDYHGRYRIWLVAAFAWLLLGVDEVASLHEAVRDLAVGLSGKPGLGSGQVWWLGAYAAVFGFIGVRLVLEMRECRTSATLFLFAAGIYGAAAALLLNGEMHWLPLPAELDPVMLEEGLTLSAPLLLLVSHLVHARYVVLEAEGEIKPRVAKPRKERASKAAKSTKEAAAKSASKEAKDDADEPATRGGLFAWMRRTKIDPPHPTPAPARKSNDLGSTVKSTSQVPSSAFRDVDDDDRPQASRLKRVQADFSEADDEEEERRDGRKLSKADRKALRRQKEMERRGY